MEFSPLLFHWGPVSVCQSAESSAVVLSPHCWLLRETRHYPAPLRGRFPTFPPSQASQHFLILEANLPWTRLWSALGWKISSAPRNPGFAFQLVLLYLGLLSGLGVSWLWDGPVINWGSSSRDFSEAGTGDMQRCDPLMSPAWLSAARPKLFTSVTFLHVRFHLLFLLAYVCFVGVLPRIEWLKIHKWREIIQTACDLKPPFWLQIEN